MSEEKKPSLSLGKIASAIVGIIILVHLKDVLRTLSRASDWLTESLEPIRDFPEGAQAAIAVFTMLLCLVVLLKLYNKI